MQVPQTESPSEFTTSAVLTAYKALPESLRPFYAHIHCGSAAIVAALGLTAEDNNVLETAASTSLAVRDSLNCLSTAGMKSG